MKVFLYVSLSLLLSVLAACSNEEDNNIPIIEESGEVLTKTIVAVGDSLTAGYGLDETKSYPYLLEKKLQAAGYINYKVVNAGVSAETSSGALSRIEWILTLNPDIVILETGANDGLRGTDVDLIEKNIRKILQLLKERNVVVLLAGMKMVLNLGPFYVADFNKIYPGLAKEFDIQLMPFFLEGVAMQRELTLGDGVHPNAKGHNIITENIYPYVLKAIKQERENG